MARIRTIKPEFWSSEQIAECSPNARLLFIGMWNFCDDAGRCKCSPNEVRMRIYPGDRCGTDAVSEWINELVTNDLIQIYEVDGQLIIQVIQWDKHQRIDRPNPSKWPPPPVPHSPSNRRTLDVGREGKGKEGRSKKEVYVSPEGSNAHPKRVRGGTEAVESRENGELPKKTQPHEIAFEILWNRWQWRGTPKGPRWKALEAWQKHVVAAGIDLKSVLGAAGAYCAQCVHTETDTCHVVTWINQKRWIDDHGLEGVDGEAAMVHKQRAEMLAAWSTVTGGDLGEVDDTGHARLVGPAGQGPAIDL